MKKTSQMTREPKIEKIDKNTDTTNFKSSLFLIHPPVLEDCRKQRLKENVRTYKFYCIIIKEECLFMYNDI